MNRFWSKTRERFLSPDEVLDDTLDDLVVYPLEPAVVLIHQVDDDIHTEALYLNDTPLFECVHFPPDPDHQCCETLAVKIARALDTKVDERRVHLGELAEANRKVVHPWGLLDFSATGEWANRGGFGQAPKTGSVR